MNPAEHILRVLDRHLTGKGEIRLLGGAAMILGYGLRRSTEDADLVMDTDELIALIEHEGLKASAVRDAMLHAVVPEAFRESYPEATQRVERLLARAGDMSPGT